MPESPFPETRKVLKVGWVGLGPFSFYGHYIHVINNIFEDYNSLNMRVTHIWADDYTRNFAGSPEFVNKLLDYWRNGENSVKECAKKCGIPNLCEDYHEMVDEVDAAMIMDFDRAYDLAEPFIRKGLPIFLCSPIAVNIPECERILDLAEQYGSAVHSGSFTQDMHSNQMLGKRVKREHIAAFQSSTAFAYFTSYANDGLEPIHKLIGHGVKTVALHGWNGSHGYDPTGIPTSRILLEYESRDGNPPIQGTVTLGGFKKEREWYRVYYRDNTILEGTAYWADLELIFHDFLVNVQKVFTTNKPIQTREEILYTLKVLIAAYKSANEGNRPVALDEVGDYRLPTVRIDKWNEIPR